jgi:hypothetical protein
MIVGSNVSVDDELSSFVFFSDLILFSCATAIEKLKQTKTSMSMPLNI